MREMSFDYAMGQTITGLGWEPWSSGYGRRLLLQRSCV